MSGGERDAPRVAPDQPNGSGDRGPRVVLALLLAAMAFILAIGVTIAILLAL